MSKWLFAQECEIDPRSGAPVLRRMLGEPQEIAELRNAHDAYRQVVFRLMEWFAGPVDEMAPFELPDFQALMLDERLMDEDYEYAGYAAEMGRAIR